MRESVPSASAGAASAAAAAAADAADDAAADRAALARELGAALDAKTKPPGSLGRLETLAVELGLAQRSRAPRADPARIVVFAADHGVAAEGVSAYPAEVTAQMVRNFAGGGAAVAVLARAADVALEVVDVGVATDLADLEGIVHDKVAPGSANLARGPAMTATELDAALEVGRRAVRRAAADGVRVLLLGEMGIGNTTAAAVLTALCCDADGGRVGGRGTGLDDAGLARKRALIERVRASLAATDDAREWLRRAGGLEIAALVGAMLEAPAHPLSLLVDGYIVTAAALVACRLETRARGPLLFAHRSAEPGHALALEALGAEPLLDLGLRLGEGSGAVLALPLLRAACSVLADMATFGEAGVSTAVG